MDSQFGIDNGTGVNSFETMLDSPTMSIQGHQPYTQTVSQVMSDDTPRWHVPINKFFDSYSAHVGLYGHKIKDLKFVFQYKETKEIEYSSGNFRMAYYDLIDIYDFNNNSLLKIDDYLIGFFGVTMTEQRSNQIAKIVKNEPFVLHTVYCAGKYHGQNYYGFIYSSIAKEDIPYFKKLLNNVLKNRVESVAMPGKPVKFGFGSKRSPSSAGSAESNES